MTDPDAASELAVGHAFGGDLHVRAGAAKDVEKRDPRAVQSEILDLDLGARQTRGGYGPERRGRQIARHGDLERPQGRAAGHADPAVAAGVDRRPKRAEGQLRMIPGRGGFAHGGGAVGLDAGQQDGTLHLGAWDGGRIVDGRERSARYSERGAILVGDDPRTHPRERFDDAAHRPAAEGRVTDEHGCERVGRQDARHQAHRGARIARIERRGRGLKTAKAAALNRDGRRAGTVARADRDLDPESAQTSKRGRAVGARRVAVDGRSPGRKRREHRVAVRDRLVPGDANPAPDAGGRAHEGFAERGHPATIPCGSRRLPRRSIVFEAVDTALRSLDRRSTIWYLDPSR